MANLQELIGMAKEQNGKFFVMDESGEVKLVILPVEDYKKLTDKHHAEPKAEDPEEINRKILQAQLLEKETIVPEIIKPVSVAAPVVRPEVRVRTPQPDLRAEVIDPSFDFEEPKGEDDSF